MPICGYINKNKVMCPFCYHKPSNLIVLDLLHMSLLQTTRMNPSREKAKKMKKVGRDTKKLMMKPCYINPWDFDEVVPLLDEELSLTKLDLGELECRSIYCIHLLSNSDINKNDLLYKIYGEEVDKSPNLMRNWTKLYSMTNKKQLERIARNFLDSTNTKLTSWMKGI